MKKILIILAIVAVAGIAAQIIINQKNSNALQATINDLGIFTSTDRVSAVEKFAGKPAVIFIVGTFCLHCQDSMPKYKTQVWDEFKDSVNVFAHVIDGEGGKRFEVADIPQGYDAQLNFETLTGEACEFVPSWVLLDADGNTVDSSCGAKKSIDVIISGIEAQLIQDPDTVQ